MGIVRIRSALSASGHPGRGAGRRQRSSRHAPRADGARRGVGAVVRCRACCTPWPTGPRRSASRGSCAASAPPTTLGAWSAGCSLPSRRPCQPTGGRCSPARPSVESVWGSAVGDFDRAAPRGCGGGVGVKRHTGILSRPPPPPKTTRSIAPLGIIYRYGGPPPMWRRALNGRKCPHGLGLRLARNRHPPSEVSEAACGPKVRFRTLVRLLPLVRSVRRGASEHGCCLRLRCGPPDEARLGSSAGGKLSWEGSSRARLLGTVAPGRCAGASGLVPLRPGLRCLRRRRIVAVGSLRGRHVRHRSPQLFSVAGSARRRGPCRRVRCPRGGGETKLVRLDAPFDVSCFPRWDRGSPCWTGTQPTGIDPSTARVCGLVGLRGLFGCARSVAMMHAVKCPEVQRHGPSGPRAQCGAHRRRLRLSWLKFRAPHCSAAAHHTLSKWTPGGENQRAPRHVVRRRCAHRNKAR